MVTGRVRVCDAGMMCGGCVGRVKRLLEGHSAVGKANVNLATETALVRVSPFSTDAHSSPQAVAEIGTSLVKVRSPLQSCSLCLVIPFVLLSACHALICAVNCVAVVLICLFSLNRLSPLSVSSLSLHLLAAIDGILGRLEWFWCSCPAAKTPVDSTVWRFW
jgi:copper chaperone CopZ